MQLDPDQARVVEAVVAGNANLRVVAAAGSGKTRTLVASVIALLHAGIPANEIIVTTFTRKAADEMKRRLADNGVAKADVDKLRCGTFHSVALAKLRGLDPDKWALANCLNIREGINERDLWTHAVDWAPKGMIPGTNIEAKSLGIKDHEPQEYQKAVDWLRSRGYRRDDPAARGAIARGEGALVALPPKLLEAWDNYTRIKVAAGLYDFADLLDAYLDMVRTQDEKIQRVLVDEAQDTDVVQRDIVLCWARRAKVALLGDMRQAIYAFRGADPDVFLSASESLAAETLSIPTNYRSVAPIVALGTQLVQKAEWSKVGEVPRPHRRASDDVEVIETMPCADQIEEARRVLADVAEQRKLGMKLDDIAILTRTNNDAALFEGVAMELRIPVFRPGGGSFWTHWVVQDFLAYAAISEVESAKALARIINRPKRFIRRETIRHIESGMQAGLGAVEAILDVARREPPGTARNLRKLADDLANLRGMEWSERVREIADLIKPEVEDAKIGAEGDADRKSDVPKLW